jgi:predicted HTH transcriptional regulator
VSHVAHRLHDNSLSAYRAEEAQLSKRAEAVLDWIKVNGPRTDRQVMQGMGFSEPNAVRPRITELIDAGKLMEVAHVRCPITGKTVRVVDLRRPRQLSLIS